MYIKESRAKYDAYDSSVWEKAYFDEHSGGFNVYHKRHDFSKAGGGGKAEKIVGKILANLGKQVEFLEEGGNKKPDIKFDEQKWDIKYIEVANVQTIRNHIKDARKADNVIFYFTIDNQYDNMINAIVRETGRFEKLNRIDELPDVYYISNGKQLDLIWGKSKEANK